MLFLSGNSRQLWLLILSILTQRLSQLPFSVPCLLLGRLLHPVLGPKSSHAFLSQNPVGLREAMVVVAAEQAGRQSHMKSGMPWKVRDNTCTELMCVRHSCHQGSAVRLSCLRWLAVLITPQCLIGGPAWPRVASELFFPQGSTYSLLCSVSMSCLNITFHCFGALMPDYYLFTLICKALAFNYPWIPLMVLRWCVFKSFLM